MKVSKNGKARLNRSNQGEKAAVRKAARLLADYDLITQGRYAAIVRQTKR